MRSAIAVSTNVKPIVIPELKQEEYALIVAGGKGMRFGSALPKQFIELNGKPVLLHTLEAFYRYSDRIHIVLVLPEEDMLTWTEVAQRHQFKKTLTLQAGGTTRFQSVRNGLAVIGDGYVAIHDGVRPLVTERVIAESFRLARMHGAAVASVSLKESIRKVSDPDGAGRSSDTLATTAVDRSLFRMVQTPQTFATQLIKEAYGLPEDALLTDDASVAERAGFPIVLFAGSYENIKITTPEDLVVAEALLKRSENLD